MSEIVLMEVPKCDRPLKHQLHYWNKALSNNTSELGIFNGYKTENKESKIILYHRWSIDSKVLDRCPFNWTIAEEGHIGVYGLNWPFKSRYYNNFSFSQTFPIDEIHDKITMIKEEGDKFILESVISDTCAKKVLLDHNKGRPIISINQNNVSLHVIVNDWYLYRRSYSNIQGIYLVDSDQVLMKRCQIEPGLISLPQNDSKGDLELVEEGKISLIK